METPCKIVIADDHRIILPGIKQIIVANKLGTVVAAVSDGLELLKFLQSNAVNLAVLDVNMPNLNGIDIAKKIKSNYPNILILMLSQYENIEMIKNLKNIGVNGYLSKNFEVNEFISAVESIKNGENYFPLLKNENLKPKDNKFNLTPREIEVLQHISNAKKTKEIARELFLSEFTVETHRKNLMRKLEVTSTLTLVHVARELGYLV